MVIATYPATTTGSQVSVRNEIAIAAATSRRPRPTASRHRDDTGGDRPEPLARVQPVLLDVAGVVEQVGAAGGEAEGDERDRRVPDRAGRREHPGRPGGGDHQDVLDPLAGTAGPQDA